MSHGRPGRGGSALERSVPGTHTPLLAGSSDGPGSRLLWLLPGFLFWGQVHGQLSDGGSQLLWQHHHHSHWRLGGQESHAPPCPPALLATHRGLHTAAPGMASRRLGNRLLRRHQVKWPQTPLFQAPPSSPASLSPEWHRGQSQEDTLFPTWPPTSDSAGRQPVQRTCSEVGPEMEIRVPPVFLGVKLRFPEHQYLHVRTILAAALLSKADGESASVLQVEP